MASTAVRVALRVRPLTEKETLNNCTQCLSFIPNEPQILIGTDKSFTYDYVFDTDADQAEIYSSAASPLLHKFLDGFNATILAYGQTGSGKTFSMGTSLDNNVHAESQGIVPRCVTELFQVLQFRQSLDNRYKYEIYTSFVELYNEEFVDLLNAQLKRPSLGNSVSQYSCYPPEAMIREDVAGNIHLSGVKEQNCSSSDEVLECLKQGSMNRATGATDMNSVSSRSHAIFSVILKQQKPEDEDGRSTTRSLQSKFHFVDLAGSERLKRTNAQGERFKEGIAINSGLLALGNVISALGDEARRATHVPYRDSKLTRFLQDSLGGNSHTLMLACVSPADINFMETLNTLKYANRARNIKNRVAVNQNYAGSSIEINQLKALISRLRIENASLRADDHSTSTGATARLTEEDNLVLKNENKRLYSRLKEITSQLCRVSSERDTLLIGRELEDFMHSEADDNILETIHAQKKILTNPIIEKYQETIQELNLELNNTKDQLASLKSLQTLKNTTNTYTGSGLLQRFSRVPSRDNSIKREFVGKTSFSLSSTKTNNALKHSFRHPILTKSTSVSIRKGNKHKKSGFSKEVYQRKESAYTETADDLDGEYSADCIPEENIRHHKEVKENIEKVRADIRKSLEVLQLVAPGTEASWETELGEQYSSQCNRMERTHSESLFSMKSSSAVDRSREIIKKSIPAFYDRKHSTSEIISNLGSKSKPKDRYNPQLYHMLKQIQSDIKMKEELVSYLEKSELEFAFMRKKFDERISHLHSQLIETQKSKDIALTRVRSGSVTKSAATTTTTKGSATAVAKRSAEIRHTYETKMKDLMTEIQELKRKYAQATKAMQSTRDQHESLLRSLRVNVETLRGEKKRLTHRMKIESDRVREKISKQEKKIQQLQRQQVKANQVKRKLERENEQNKHILKKKTEEVMINSNQVKQLVSIVKKAVREGGLLDERILNRLAPIIGGHFAVIARGGGHGYPKRETRRKSTIPLEIRATRKKELLDKALYQYIQGKQAVVEMEQLLMRREQLVVEKLELQEESSQVYHAEKEHEERTGQLMDTMAIELIDERMDLISAEISYLSTQISTLQKVAAYDILEDDTLAPKSTKHVTFADEIIANSSINDEWADIDSFEEQYRIPPNASPEAAYDIASKILKSFDNSECRFIIENLIDDVMDLKMNEYSQQLTIQNLETTVTEFHHRLTAQNSEESGQVASQSSTNSDDIFDITMQNSGDCSSIDNCLTPGFVTSHLCHYGNQNSQVNLPDSPALSPPFRNNPFSNFTDLTFTDNVNANNNSIMSNSKPFVPRIVTSNNNTTSTEARRSTPSPERFYNMMQDRLPWQQRVIESETANENTCSAVESPPDFDHYVSDHDSSSSTIRSNHYRNGSLIQTQKSEDSGPSETIVSAFLARINAHRNLDGDQQGTSLLSHSCQPPDTDKAVYSPAPSLSAFDRPTTPSVFDRLAQMSTTSSQAKINNRQSMDGLSSRLESQ